MGMLDVDRLNAASKRLGDAVISPSTWPRLMEEICQAVGATGATMLQSDVRTSDVPMTPSLAEYLQNYFANNYHVSDVRAVRGVPRLLAGAPVIADEDIFSSEQDMLRDPLYANLGAYGFRWFAAVGFRSGSALWGLSIQRTPQEGAFTRPELNAMGKLSRRLSETATLSKAVGRLVLSGVSSALNLVRQPAIAIDRLGMVIEINSEAEALFDAEIRIRNRRLLIRETRARIQLRSRDRSNPEYAGYRCIAPGTHRGAARSEAACGDQIPARGRCCARAVSRSASTSDVDRSVEPITT